MESRLRICLCLFLISFSAKALPQTDPFPNIICILADDMGYGDISHLNRGRGRIVTPHLDRLAQEGMVFTEAHSGSSVCTPTRYGLLTGRYAWRTRLQNGVLLGYSPPLISPDRLTLAGLLKQRGYTTACIGKWHLGMDIPRPATNESMIRNGPTERGFDYFFGISASLDMPPFAYIRNDHFTEAPTVQKKWVREGPAAPGFEAIGVLPQLATEATAFIRRQSNKAAPFFLYLSLTSPHTPIVPAAEWQGKSGIGEYGDFVMATDGVVGEVIQALHDAGIEEETLLLFTSDNGCSPAANTDHLEKLGHFASVDRRGYKADIFDGGHRVPLLMRWPGNIPPASTNQQAVCLTDMMATCADITEQELPHDAAEDSFSLMPILLGTGPSKRESLVHHSIHGAFAIRQGRWKLALCADSGGWSPPRPTRDTSKGEKKFQLFDMQAVPSEQQNLESKHPDIVDTLKKSLQEIVENGRSTPGPKQANDVKVNIVKFKE